jgi:hypothetical protein
VCALSACGVACYRLLCVRVFAVLAPNWEGVRACACVCAEDGGAAAGVRWVGCARFQHACMCLPRCVRLYVTLRRGGRWTTVVVDDQFPCTQARGEHPFPPVILLLAFLPRSPPTLLALYSSLPFSSFFLTSSLSPSFPTPFLLPFFPPSESSLHPCTPSSTPLSKLVPFLRLSPHSNTHVPRGFTHARNPTERPDSFTHKHTNTRARASICASSPHTQGVTHAGCSNHEWSGVDPSRPGPSITRRRLHCLPGAHTRRALGPDLRIAHAKDSLQLSRALEPDLRVAARQRGGCQEREGALGHGL